LCLIYVQCIHVVSQVNLDESLRAVGVTYQRDGRTLSIKATKEVILSAGSIGTPQLLMLSGIGDPAHLSSLGVLSDINIHRTKVCDVQQKIRLRTTVILRLPQK